MSERWSMFRLVEYYFPLKKNLFKDDIALNHAACKTIENLLLVADKQADKLATTDIALALWNISSIVGNNEHLRASALAVGRKHWGFFLLFNRTRNFHSGSLSYGFIVSRYCSIRD
jgi:hypothetical protein